MVEDLRRFELVRQNETPLEVEINQKLEEMGPNQQ